MTMPGQPEPPERSDSEVRWRRLERRRERIHRQVRHDRAGDHRIPTWVLAAILGLLLAGWACLIITT